MDTITIMKDMNIVVPFAEVLFPYTEHFLINLGLELPSSIVYKLHNKLLEDLSFVSEVILQKELDDFVTSGKNNFEEFVEEMKRILSDKYPVLDRVLLVKRDNFTKHISKIINRFNEDRIKIENIFCKSSKRNNIKVVDINTSLGDGHNGEGTAMVLLSDGTKLIYKPRNIDVTNAYNEFIMWVNAKMETNLKIFKVINCVEYGWIEFVDSKEVHSRDKLEKYYYEAGILLAVTLLLGSKDCHHENVIASGEKPVMIDHETIIQPFFNNQSFRTWDNQFGIPPFSVLESSLIVNLGTGAPLDIVGFGIKENIEVTELEKKVQNPNTINSKRTTRFVTRKIVDKNIPVFEGKYIFAKDYKKNLLEGFSNAYDMFSDSKGELRHKDSPIKSFENKKIRYVWRPTFVYFRILRYMRTPSFMVNFDAYYSKMYDLLSRAFKGENKEEYKFILDFEIKQMLNGDIPIFSLDSSDNFLGDKKFLEVFEHNCLENIHYRVNSLTLKHKKEQLEYITRWLNS